MEREKTVMVKIELDVKAFPKNDPDIETKIDGTTKSPQAMEAKHKRQAALSKSSLTRIDNMEGEAWQQPYFWNGQRLFFKAYQRHELHTLRFFFFPETRSLKWTYRPALNLPYMEAANGNLRQTIPSASSPPELLAAKQV